MLMKSHVSVRELHIGLLWCAIVCIWICFHCVWPPFALRVPVLRVVYTGAVVQRAGGRWTAALCAYRPHVPAAVVIRLCVCVCLCVVYRHGRRLNALLLLFTRSQAATVANV